MEYNELESNIGHIFIKKNLLDRALTTKGCVNESKQQNPNSPPIQSQDAFCTLGDAVLKLILVDYLIKNKGYNKSGEITEEKNKLRIEKHLPRLVGNLILVIS